MVDFLPLIGIGLVIAMIAFMAYYWRAISDAIGHGMSRQRQASRKKSRRVQFLVSVAFWALAIYVLLNKCGGLLCNAPAQAATLPKDLTTAVTNSAPIPSLPFLDRVIQLNSLVQTNWFYIALAGLLVVSGVIMGRGIIVSWQETRAEALSQIGVVQAAGVVAVEDAFRILKTQPEKDARTRIINCYERMLHAAQRSGTMVTLDQTARELETSIRKMLVVKGPEIRELTSLFEEARYSLHPIVEDDAALAEKCLVGIAEELNIQLASDN